MTTTQTARRIEKPSRIGIAILDDLGIAYERTTFTVTVDEEGGREGWAPGDYDWITVDATTAARWDAGILACRGRGMKAGHDAGRSLRRHVMSTGAAAGWAAPSGQTTLAGSPV